MALDNNEALAGFGQRLQPTTDPSGLASAAAPARPRLSRLVTCVLGYVAFSALVGVLVLVAVATVPTLFGYHNYVVYGGSMEPAIEAGSVAVTQTTSPDELKVGDIIARRDGGTPVLHRIIDFETVDGQRVFITQGDENETPDPEPVGLSGQGDRVLFSVPYVGYVLNYTNSWPGRLLLIGVPAALLAAIFLRDLGRRRAAAAPGPGALASTDDIDAAARADERERRAA